MKTEINLESKRKFFAAHYTDDAVVVRQGFNNRSNNSPMYIDEHDFLERVPLSQISREDAIHIARLSGHCPAWKINADFEIYENHFGDRVVSWSDDPKCCIVLKDCTGRFTLKQYDYMRSRGYAIEWNGITVEEQIQNGWIKLKEQ